MREAFLLFWVLQQLTSCFSSMGSQFYFTEGEMTNIFSLNLDERYGASFYSVNTTTGNLSQPIELIATISLDVKDPIISIEMDGNQYSNRSFNGRGFLIDDEANVYVSQSPSGFQGQIPIPEFRKAFKVPQPKTGLVDFFCGDLAILTDSLAVLCQFRKKSSHPWELGLFTFDSGSFESIGEVQLPIFGENIDNLDAQMVYNADTEIMKGLLFILVPNNYIQVFDIRDPRRPSPVSVIDYTLDPSIYPIGLKTMGTSLVILSQNGSAFSLSTVSVDSNIEFTLNKTLKPQELSNASPDFAVYGHTAFFITGETALSINLATMQVQNITDHHFRGNSSLRVCGSSAFINFFSYSPAQNPLLISSFSSQELQSYSQKEILFGGNSTVRLACDGVNDLIYVYIDPTLTIFQVGKPVYQIDQAVNETIKITAETLLEGGSKSVTTESFSLQQINQLSNFSVSPLTHSSFTSFTSGSFTIPFSYSLVNYGANIQYSIGPNGLYDYHQANSAYPLTSFFQFERVSQVLYNTESSSSSADFQFTILPSRSSSTSLFEFLKFRGVQTKDKNYRTVVFGCSAGQSTAREFFCLGRSTIFHSSLLLGVMAIQKGFMAHWNNGTFSAYLYHSTSPYLEIQPQNGAQCMIAMENKLACVDSAGHVVVYRVDSEGEESPVYFLNETIEGNEMHARQLKESQAVSGVIGIATGAAVYLYDFSSFSRAVYVETVERFKGETEIELNYIAEKHISIKANNTIHTYEHTKNKGGRSIFLKKYSYNLDNETKVLGSNERNCSVYLSQSGLLQVLKAGPSMSGANNPISLFAKASSSPQLSVLNFKDMDILFDDLDLSGSSSPILVHDFPSLTVFPETKNLNDDSYEMPVQINITNTHKTKHVSADLKFSLYNSFLNFTVNPKFLQEPNFNFTSGGHFNVQKSKVFNNGSILFIYLNASNYDDIQHYINYTNPVSVVSSSLLKSINPDLNIVDIEEAGFGTEMLQGQKVVSFLKLTDLRNPQEYRVEIDGVSDNDTSFHCMKGAFHNSTGVSACQAKGENYLVFYKKGRSTVERMGQVALNEMKGQEIYDLLVFDELIVVQGEQKAYFYKTEFERENETKGRKWGNLDQKAKEENERGGHNMSENGPVKDLNGFDKAKSDFTSLSFRLFQEIENVQMIEYESDGGSFLFLLCSASGRLTAFQYDSDPSYPKNITVPFPIFKNLSGIYPFFQNPESVSVSGHLCEFKYSKESSLPIKTRCIFSSNFGDADVSLDIVLQPFDILNDGLFGVYLPFGTFVSSGQMLLTPSYYLTIVQRPSFWVGSAQKPADRFVLLVYKRIGSSLQPTHFSLNDCTRFLGGVPGHAFFLEDNSHFRPVLHQTYTLKQGQEDPFESFLVTSNQFLKIVQYQIKGEMELSYKFFYGEIKSKEYFDLKAFNDFESMAVEKPFDSNNLSSWLLTVSVYVGTGVFFAFVACLCWGAYFIETKIKEKNEENALEA